MPTVQKYHPPRRRRLVVGKVNTPPNSFIRDTGLSGFAILSAAQNRPTLSRAVLAAVVGSAGTRSGPSAGWSSTRPAHKRRNASPSSLAALIRWRRCAQNAASRSRPAAHSNCWPAAHEGEHPRRLPALAGRTGWLDRRLAGITPQTCWRLMMRGASIRLRRTRIPHLSRVWKRRGPSTQLGEVPVGIARRAPGVGYGAAQATAHRGRPAAAWRKQVEASRTRPCAT